MKKFLIMMLVMFASMTYTVASTYNSVDNTDDKTKLEYVNNNYTTPTPINLIKVGMPSTIDVVKGDSFQIAFRTLDNDLYENIKYEIQDSVLKIWVENMYEDLYNLDFKNIKIRIMIPNDHIKIKTLNSNLLVASNDSKKKRLTSYENN